MELTTHMNTFNETVRGTDPDQSQSMLPVEDSQALRTTLYRLLVSLGLDLRGLDHESGTVDAHVLNDLLHGLQRRLAASEFRPAPVELWSYDQARWRLLAPNGREAQLSLAESQLIRCLFSRKREVVSREELLVALSRPQLESFRRNLDVTISRLRKKVEMLCGMRLPLASARGHGYVFNAAAEVLG
ncbi:MAG TPA: winged helix-turn-helix domain-containing protein [Fontimonas sp.]